VRQVLLQLHSFGWQQALLSAASAILAMIVACHLAVHLHG